MSKITFRPILVIFTTSGLKKLRYAKKFKSKIFACENIPIYGMMLTRRERGLEVGIILTLRVNKVIYERPQILLTLSLHLIHVHVDLASFCSEKLNIYGLGYEAILVYLYTLDIKIKLKSCFYRSMYFDEDGHLAHEFYREEKVTSPSGVVRWKMKKIFRHLSPQVLYSRSTAMYYDRIYTCTIIQFV